MASTSDFRNGLTIEFKNGIYSIVYFQHVKPGKGAAFVRTKLKNLKTGAVIENTFRAGEKVTEVRCERRAYQYLYNTGDLYYLMDNDTYEQIPVPAQLFGDSIKYLTENMEVSVLRADNEIIGIEIPLFVELEVTETEPGFKGDTSQAPSKPATLSTGAVVQVPIFIEIGDVLKIDTRTDQYLERVKK